MTWFFRAGRNLALLGSVLLSGAVQVAILAVPALAAAELYKALLRDSRPLHA